MNFFQLARIGRQVIEEADPVDAPMSPVGRGTASQYIPKKMIKAKRPKPPKKAGLAEATPFEFGSRIGRTRAHLMDQYHRDEADDPRQKLMLIDQLLDEIIGKWVADPATAPHAEHIKAGMDHGYEDSTNVLDQLRAVDLKKKRQAIKQELEGMKDGMQKRKLEAELASVEEEMAARQAGPDGDGGMDPNEPPPEAPDMEYGPPQAKPKKKEKKGLDKAGPPRASESDRAPAAIKNKRPFMGGSQ